MHKEVSSNIFHKKERLEATQIFSNSSVVTFLKQVRFIHFIDDSIHLFEEKKIKVNLNYLYRNSKLKMQDGEKHTYFYSFCINKKDMLTYTCLYMSRNFITNTQETINIGFSLGRITGDLRWKENFDFIYVFKYMNRFCIL